jgi:hypothetical protein
MTFDDRRRLALSLLRDKGVAAWVAAPPIHRLLWRVGVDVAPPHFASPWGNVALLAPLMLPLTFALMPLNADSGWEAIWEAVSGAFFGGLAASLGYRQQAATYALPKWEDLEADTPPGGAPSRVRSSSQFLRSGAVSRRTM